MENVLFYHQTHTHIHRYIKEWKLLANLYWKHVGVIVNTLVYLASTCTILNKIRMEFDICEKTLKVTHRRWIMSHLKMARMTNGFILSWELLRCFFGLALRKMSYEAGKIC